MSRTQVSRIWSAKAVTTVALVLVSSVVAPVFAATKITSIAGNISPTQVFLDDTWCIPSDGSNGDYSAGTVIGANYTIWRIAPTSITGAYPAALDWDDNVLIPPDFSQGGLADGLFEAGGTLSLSGKVYNSSNVLLYDGLLMTGAVWRFRMTETGAGTNNIIGNATFHPTGGYLLTNTTMNLQGEYVVNFKGYGAQQDGGDLDDWSGFVNVNSVQISFNAPEPTTAVMAAGVLACMALSRRRRS